MKPLRIWHNRELCNYAARSVKLTKQQYNFLLPAWKLHLMERYINPYFSEYYFCGNPEDISEIRDILFALNW